MKIMKVLLRSAILATLLVILAVIALITPEKHPFSTDENPVVRFRTEGKTFQIWQDDQWQTTQLVGVNMGSGYPGAFPNDGAISEETYLRWFCQISEMNANVIRVYQLQSPSFYEALLQYNQSHDRPLYLIQGIDFPDQLMYSDKNMLNPDTTAGLYRDTKKLIKALHGNALSLNGEKETLRIYTADVSPYLLAYNLGVEWDELFVEYVCRSNPGAVPYTGTYFACTQQASPFESFLAAWGNEVLRIETEAYGNQPIISFANWAETDPLINEVQMISLNRRIPRRNVETPIDIEHIRPTEKNQSGLFAAYNIYPYYPLFLQYGSYTLYTDSQGRHNPYQAYLKALVDHHSYPVVISEYGVPASRSTAYEDIWREYHHGGLNETQQGHAIADLHRDIVEAGCAGSLVFTWQDEWFKRTWNEMQMSDPDGRANWSNAMSVEQAFGLLAFEPGTPESIVYPDGDISEWTSKDLVAKTKDSKLYMRSDERYVYFMVEGLDHTDGNHAVNLALDVTPKSGERQEGSHSFSRAVDFLVHLNLNGDGELLVHAPYDLLVYSMADKLHPSMSGYMVRQLLEIYYPGEITAETMHQFHSIGRACGSVDAQMRHRYTIAPAGTLVQGNGNPNSPDFNSNADYCVNGDVLELRIPWQLLNFRDPSRGLIVDNLVEQQLTIHNLKIDALYAAAYFDDAQKVKRFGKYDLDGWLEPQWHERLKASYYILQEEFKGLN